jgi:CHASE3 domain sensor protein
MALSANDVELIKQTVQAAVLEGTRNLATKDEFKAFRDEVRADLDKGYSREMIDQFRKEADEEHARMWAEINDSKNALKTLWSNAWFKVICLAAGVAQLLELWAIIQGR